jgi:hypothetical protein
MKEIHMRMTAAILVGALGLAASAVSANAAPVLPSANQHDTNIVQVAGGCGPGLHPNRWGRCIPNRYSYYGARPYWRGWRSPSDNVARELNRRELGRNYYGSSRPY